VSCVNRQDLEAGMMQTIRLDTGEVVRDRQLTAFERQGTLIPRTLAEFSAGDL
jgi:hypothetical protein